MDKISFSAKYSLGLFLVNQLICSIALAFDFFYIFLLRSELVQSIA